MNVPFVVYRLSDGEIVQSGVIQEQHLADLVTNPGEMSKRVDGAYPALAYRVDIDSPDHPIVRKPDPGV